ncbi:MAG: DUF4340 domain-containing protein [Roseburia sp.]
MEKQKRQFVIILAVLVVMILAYVGIHFYNKKAEEKEAAEEDAATVTITDFDTDDVTAFSYQLNGETLSFTKEGDNWLYDGDATLDLDESVMETMLSAASNLTATEELDDYDSLADYGLDAPENTITITTSEGVITLMVGNSNEITGDYYIMTGDSDTVYLIGSSLSSSFGKTVEELIAEEEETEVTEEVETTEEVEITEEVETTEEAEVTEAD